MKGKEKREMRIAGLRLHTLSIEKSTKIEIIIYDHGCNVKDDVKKALRNGDSITIAGRTIWRENHSVGQGSNHDYIWDELGEKILVEEILKVRNDKTNDLKIIRGRQKYMNYARYEKE